MTSLFSRFLNNRNGNFGMVLALAFPALMASVALGLDLSNTLSTKTEMQDANDAAVLSAARYFKEYRKQPSLATVQAFLDGNSTFKITAKKLIFNKSRTEFTLESDTTDKTILMGYFGKKYQNYQSISKANLGFSDTLEFALSLDTTGSMDVDGKMDGLKVAANDFIDAMFDAKDRGADIKGGIVPFAQYVNVGASRRGEPWLNVPKDIDTRVTTNVCRKEKPVTGTTNCKSVYSPARTIDHPATGPSCAKKDGVKKCTPGSAAWTETVAAGTSNQCDNTYGPEQTICGNVTTGTLITWQGIVGSRDYPLNIKDGTYSKRVPGLVDVSGPAELQTLTDDRQKLLDKIAGLTPSGETYMPEGIIWGTRLLTKKAPFTEGKTTGAGGRPVRKVLIVMTDGMNTLAPKGAIHVGSDIPAEQDAIETLANQYTIEACNEAKAQKLEIFTISFGNDVPSSVKDMLEACATTPDKFFNAKSSADLKLAFEGIANQMLNVRLSQ